MKTGIYSKIIIIFISLLIGLIYIYPDLCFVYELKNEFKGIALTATHDELGYLACIKAVYKGNLTCSGIDIYEHRNALWTQPFFSELIEGSIGKLLRIDVIRLDILMSFFLPVILFWLIFILLLSLSDSKAYSLLGATFILLGYSVFTGTPVAILKEIFVTHRFSEPLWFLRPISPQFNHIVFILTLIMIYSGIMQKKRLGVLLSVFLVGALFYVHPHYWTYIYVGLFLLLLSSFSIKDKNTLKSTSLIIILSFLISIPYWIHAYQIKLNLNYLDALTFAGLVYTHKPILPVLHIVLSIGIIAILWLLRDVNIAFFASFLIGGLLCLNQQVVTGVTLVPGHWQGYTNKTFLIIALVYVLFRIITRLKKGDAIRFFKLFKVSLFLGILFLYAIGFRQQDNYYRANKANMRERQAIAGVYNWLNRNTKNTDVVLTDPYNYLLGKSPYNLEVLTYTDCYTYLPIMYTSLLSKEEYEDRILTALRFFNYPLETVNFYLTHVNGGYFFGLRAHPDYGNNLIPASEIKRIIDRYVSLYNLDMIQAIKKYKVDYAIVENKYSPQYDLLIKKNKLIPVYKDKNFSILKII